ncbi:conserved Plasmodium protein, unknown function [Plasmodium ovale]|uniref:C2 domain-containing protein n=1 Tax=Plasmodium ovale TaxID=36330 RepID=A0A1D3THJ5_PLAOA|nr:conserved Plasmodium protein, unknown function [Plasmodium ovale]
MVTNTRSSNNEKILRFSKGLVLENGSYLINVKDDVVLNRYKWWKGLTKPKDTFNPRKTKGFLVLKLFLYGYLNRISTYRSNKDNDLMHPYLKILLNNVEVYRTKVLDSSINIWEEKIEIEIHYIKSKIEIQLFDMDETEGIVEDEFIGSALIDITYLQLSKKYDIILKYINKMAILMDPYRYKKEQKDHFDIHTSEHMSGHRENMTFNPTHHDRDKYNSKKKGIIGEENKSRNNSETTTSPQKINYTNDYNVRIFVKLSNKKNYNSFILQLNAITSLNYTCINKKNEILDKDLNINQLYDELKMIKLNIDTIWLPFFSIIYNFASWKTPLYSVFFVTFFFFSFFFSKFFFSFFLVVLSLLFFILVSIIRESDQIKKGNKFTGCTQEERKSKKKNNNSSFIYWTQAKQLGGYRMNHAEEYLIGNSLKEGDHLGNSAVPSCSGSDNSSGSGAESESGTGSDSGSSDISGNSSSADSFSLDDVSTDQSMDPPNHRSDVESSVCNNSSQEELNWKDVVRGRKQKGDIGDSRRGKTKQAVSNVTDEGSKTGKKKRPNGHRSIRGRNSNNEENSSILNNTDEYNKNNGTSANANAKVNHDVSPHGNSDSNNTTYTNAHCNHSTEVDTEINLSVIKTFVANVIDDDIINNVKYFHYIVFCIMKWSQIFLYVFRKFGYFLVIISLLFCFLNIFFYPFVTKLLRFSIFSSGFILLTYNFKPTNILYRFFICIQEYYFLEMKRRKVDIYSSL